MAERLKDFASEQVGVNGLIYKAGMTNTDSDIDGLGIGYDQNEWLSGNVGTIIDEVHGGLMVNASQESSSSYYLNLAIPTEKRIPLASRGAFQIEIYLSDLTSKNLVNQWFMQSGEAGTYALGIIDKLDVKPNVGPGSGYPQVTHDLNDNEALINPVSITSASTQVDSAKCASPIIVIHDGIPTSGGFFTYAKSWTHEWLDTYINGILVNRMRRKDGSVAAAKSITLFKHQLNVSVAQRSLLLYDRPFDDVMRGDLRIVSTSHSFGARENLTRHDNSGTPGTTVGFCGLEMVGSQLQANINRNIDYRTLAFSGNTLTDFYNRINDASFTYSLGGGTYLNPVSRARPHFCIVWGHTNGEGASFTDRTDAVDQISALLISEGIIPIFVNEQNRDKHVTPADFTTENAEYVAAVRAQQINNDMGMADLWDESGGSAVDATWIESGDTNQFHPNMKALSFYGAAIAAEINRLLDDLPDYSNLAQGK